MLVGGLAVDPGGARCHPAIFLAAVATASGVKPELLEMQVDVERGLVAATAAVVADNEPATWGHYLFEQALQICLLAVPWNVFKQRVHEVVAALGLPVERVGDREVRGMLRKAHSGQLDQFRHEVDTVGREGDAALRAPGDQIL